MNQVPRDYYEAGTLVDSNVNSAKFQQGKAKGKRFQEKLIASDAYKRHHRDDGWKSQRKARHQFRT